MVQTAVADPVLREGQICQGPWKPEIISKVAEGALAAGHLVKYGTDRETQCLELPALPAADTDAIIVLAGGVMTSAVAAQTIAASAFNGVIGRDRIIPARVISVTFSAANLTDWDTPGGELRIDVYGTDALGAEIKDTIVRANGTAAATVHYSKKAFASVTSVDVEASNGATGTAIMGVANNKVELSSKDYPGVALYESMKEPNTAAREFAQYDDVSILTKGVVAVVVEHAVSVGDDAYVRVLAAGANITGQWTGQDGADTPGTYARFPGARFISAAAATGLAKLELTGV